MELSLLLACKSVDSICVTNVYEIPVLTKNIVIYVETKFVFKVKCCLDYKSINSSKEKINLNGYHAL